MATATVDVVKDVGLFAERILERPLWEHQLKAARADEFITTIAAARRTGKTTLVETLAAHTAFSNRNAIVVILSATQEAARRVTEAIGELLASSDITRGSVIDQHSTRVRLKNGSEIVSLPASQRQVRGYGANVLLLVIDEAGFVSEELWRAAHYIALDERAQGSRILLCGTPWGGPEHFFHAAFTAGRDGDTDHSSHHWTYKVNPKLDHAYLERMQHRVSPAEYAAEVLGEWSDAIGSLFPRKLLEANTADLILPEWHRVKARGLWGVDWGVSFDRSAAVQLTRVPHVGGDAPRPKKPVYAVSALKIWPAGHQLSDVVSEVLEAPAVPSVLSCETNGVGAGPSQELRRRIRERQRQFTINFVNTTAAKKTAAYGRLLWLFEEKRLIVPRHPDLLRQLAGLRFEQGEHGTLKIEAESAKLHDDVADALMLATGPFDKKAKSRSALADIDARQLPTTPLRDQVETVTTGAGIHVPARPYCQAIDGPEVTAP